MTHKPVSCTKLLVRETCIVWHQLNDFSRSDQMSCSVMHCCLL